MLNLKHTLKTLTCAAALGAAALMTGCQTSLESTEIAASPDYWQEMQDKLASLQRFSISGRLAMTGSTSFSANFTAEGTQDGYKLTLTSPFGATLARLETGPDFAELTADSKTYRADNADELFYDAFGLELPAGSFKQILLGLIGPASLLRPDGQLMSTAVNGGFVVNYQSFAEFSGYALPTALEINKGSLYIKVRVSEVKYLE